MRNLILIMVALLLAVPTYAWAESQSEAAKDGKLRLEDRESMGAGDEQDELNSKLDSSLTYEEKIDKKDKSVRDYIERRRQLDTCEGANCGLKGARGQEKQDENAETGQAGQAEECQGPSCALAQDNLKEKFMKTANVGPENEDDGDAATKESKKRKSSEMKADECRGPKCEFESKKLKDKFMKMANVGPEDEDEDDSAIIDTQLRQPSRTERAQCVGADCSEDVLERLRRQYRVRQAQPSRFDDNSAPVEYRSHNRIPCVGEACGIQQKHRQDVIMERREISKPKPMD